MLFNTHSHFSEKPEYVKQYLQECKELNVNYICVVGYDYISSLNALNCAKENKNIYAICGLQPQEVNKYNGDFADFIELFNDEKCVGIGEIGLDYYYGKEDKDRQLMMFEKQLQIACNYKKPIQIHCRDAHEDTFNLLSKYADKLDGIILHCYTGSVEMMKRYLSLGAYISITGVVTFKNAITMKEVVKNCPIERLLVETDDPYLTPVPFRGKENKPSYVYYVASAIAELKELPFEEVALQLTKNAKKVFHL